MIRSSSRRRAGAVAALALLAFSGCGGEDDDARPSERPRPPAASDRTAPPQRGSRNGGDELVRSNGGPRVETVATGLEVPWEIAFLPDGRALITERPGRVRLLSAGGELRGEPVAEIDVSAQGEGGLLGLAVDPKFEDNRFIYVYFTAGDEMEVARYRFEDGELTEEARLLDGVQAGPIHDSGRIHFGPDGALYVSTGDAGQPDLAQDADALNGKFLRFSPNQYRGEGGRPQIVSRGHRNPQGFDWEPRTDRLVATEHGPTGDDEVNAIRQGRNYGWPEVEGPDHGTFTAPLTVYEDTIAPSGSTFVSLPRSAWTGDYLIAALAGRQLRRIRLERDRVTVNEPLYEGEFGRLRAVVEGPDGALYALTSNRDGRGSPRGNDDRVLRIVPPAD